MKKKIISLLLILVLTVTAFSVASFASDVLSGDYTVSVSTAITKSRGAVIVSDKKADEGEKVEVTITPKDGFIVKAGSVVYTYSNGGTITKALVNRVDENALGEKLYFTMPAANVTVYAEFISAEENNYSFDMVASSVKSDDETFKAGSFSQMRFVSRLYFQPSARDINTGVMIFKKNGVYDAEKTTVAEVGTLYAKTEILGATNQLTLEAVGTNGIEKSVAYTSTPVSDNFSDITRCYVDFAVNIPVEDSATDYTVKSYIKFADGEVVYSKERTDFADNVAERLGLCETDGSNVDATLTILNDTTKNEEPVNTSFEGFGAVMYPWTLTCYNMSDVNVTLAKIQASKEVRLMKEAGITKVRLIVADLQAPYYDFNTKTATAIPDSGWYSEAWKAMFDAFKLHGIKVQLNFGWGTEFANSMKNKNIASVLGKTFYDYGLTTFADQAKAYGQLSAELVDFLIDKGYKSCIDSITFLSEPGNGWKGSTWYEVVNQSPQLNFTNTIKAYDDCAKSVQTALTDKGITDIPFVYGNVSLLYDKQDIDGGNTIDWWNRTSIEWKGGFLGLETLTHNFIPGKDWVKTMVDTAKNSGTTVDSYSYHYYGKFNDAKVSNYTANWTALEAIKAALSGIKLADGTELTTNAIYMDEVSVKYYDSKEAANDKSKESPFEATQLAEYLSALMNGGYKGAYLWTFSDFSSDNMYGLMPGAESAANGNGTPYDRYYATTLVTKYLNSCSTIYAGTQSNGCVTVMGKDSDGNTTVLVVNMNHTNKTVNVKFGENLGATLKRHLYNPSVNFRTIEGKTIGVDKQFENVADSFTDTIPAGGVAIYTTK